jgi:hypothetical protein
LIRTISPPNDESGVSSETDVTGAADGKLVVVVEVVGGAIETVPRKLFVGVGAGVKVATWGLVTTNGASKARSSRGWIASSRYARRRRCAGPRACGRDG